METPSLALCYCTSACARGSTASFAGYTMTYLTLSSSGPELSIRSSFIYVPFALTGYSTYADPSNSAKIRLSGVGAGPGNDSLLGVSHGWKHPHISKL